MTFPVLSIIICTKNRRNDLEITLQSVFLQSQLPDSIIIVDDSATQETENLVREYSASVPVKLIYVRSSMPHTGLPASRNTGIQNLPAATEIILFLDDDVTLEKSYLESILTIFLTNPEISGCTGFITNAYYSRPAYEKFLLWIIGVINPVLVPVSIFEPSVARTGEAIAPLFQKKEKNHIKAQWLSGSNMAYRRKVFLDSHSFDEHLTRYALGEDMIFSHMLFREGKQLIMVYNARLIHRVSPDDRIPPLAKFVMALGYRRYAIRKCFGQHRMNRIFFRLFIIQYITAAFALSLKMNGNLDYWKQAMKGYRIARTLFRDTDDVNLSKINEFCSKSFS
ncbi:MAG: glycosyltransferase [Methanoregula sp.]|jgi:glycosyltransferase involved in cell wall biosynthesis|uniref:glycosyltransferase family 2 protein n=1 Tax=Methanoregula sp. TaxID=2052170 RepID=UPI003C13D870